MLAQVCSWLELTGIPAHVVIKCPVKILGTVKPEAPVRQLAERKVRKVMSSAFSFICTVLVCVNTQCNYSFFQILFLTQGVGNKNFVTCAVLESLTLLIWGFGVFAWAVLNSLRTT